MMLLSVKHRNRLAAAGALVFGLTLAGCKKESISSYQVPKEDYSPKLPANSAGAMAARPAVPNLKWELPKGWQEKAGEETRVGTFRIEDGGEKFAEVRIVPMQAGLDIAQVVDMWRHELELPDSSAHETKPGEIEVGGLKASLYDFTGTEPKILGKYKARTTAAVLPRDGMLWFFKMSGEESVVTREQEAFRNFLKSISFQDQAVASAAPSETAARTGWKIPSGWTEQPAGQMLLAAYKAGGATITVSTLSGTGGGLLPNINRWRGQLGLSPAAGVENLEGVKSIQLSDGTNASAVDMNGTSAQTGKAARMYGLIVPRGGQTWFYKMTGDNDAVAAEIANLTEFAATAH